MINGPKVPPVYTQKEFNQCLMVFAAEAVKTKITAKMWKTLEVFRAWFDITPEPKKCFTLRASKSLFSDSN